MKNLWRQSLASACQAAIIASILFFLFFFILRSVVQNSLLKDSVHRAEHWFTTVAAYPNIQNESTSIAEQFCTKFKNPSLKLQLLKINLPINQSARLTPVCSEIDLPLKEAFALESARDLAKDIEEALKIGFGSMRVKWKGESWLFASYRLSDSLLMRGAFRLQAAENELNEIDSIASLVIGGFAFIIGIFQFFISFYSRQNHRRLLFKVQSIRAHSQKNRSEEVFKEGELDWEADWENVEHEIEKLGNSLDQKQLKIMARQTEFQEILGAIEEGVLIIDSDEKVRYYNESFKNMFDSRQSSQQSSVQKSTLREWVRAPEVLDLVEEAKESKDFLSREITFTQLEPGSLKAGNKPLRTVNLRISFLTKVERSKLDFPEQKSEAVSVNGKILLIFTVIGESAQRKMEWVVNTSHELRTPLTAIKGYSDLLVSDFKQGRFELVEEATKSIQTNTDRLLRLVQQLLATDDQGQSLDSDSKFEKNVSLEVLISEALDSVKILKERKKIQVGVLLPVESEKDFAQDLSFTGSRFLKLRQILVNLLENAIRYYPEFSVRKPPEGRFPVELEFKRNPNELVFLVRDFGHGIPEEFHNKIFDRFFRVDQGRTKEAGGSGLGLAIVKEYLLQLGGTIQLRNLTNVQGGVIGVEFEVRVPQ